MKIRIHETISNIYSENKEKLIKTTVGESYVLYPSEGKAIRNKLTDEIFTNFIGIGTKDSIENYEEIDWEVI